jgi:hypothetical protein
MLGIEKGGSDFDARDAIRMEKQAQTGACKTRSMSHLSRPMRFTAIGDGTHSLRNSGFLNSSTAQQTAVCLLSSPGIPTLNVVASLLALGCPAQTDDLLFTAVELASTVFIDE